MPTKILEIQLHPTPEQVALFKEWQEHATRTYNDVLFKLYHLQYQRRLIPCLDTPDREELFQLAPIQIDRVKVGEEYRDSCAIGRNVRKDRTKSWDAANVEFRRCCNLVPPDWLAPCPLENYQFFTVKKHFTKRHYDSGNLPSCYLDSVVERACLAWERYQKGIGGKPSYKGKGNPVSSFSFSFRHVSRYTGTHFHMPGWGAHEAPMRLHAAIHRLAVAIASDPMAFPKVAAAIAPPNPDKPKKKTTKRQYSLDEAISAYSTPGAAGLIHRNGRFYLQCSMAEVPRTPSGRPKPSVVIRCGKDWLYSTGQNKIPHLDATTLTQRAERLRQVLATKKYGSANWLKLKQKMKDLDRRIALQRRRWQQYQAQWLTDRYGHILVEQVKVDESIGRPIAISKNGEYLPNGATAEAERNREVLSLALGQFIALLKEQGERRGCEITVAEAPNEEIRAAVQVQPIPERASSLPKRNRKRERAIG